MRLNKILYDLFIEKAKRITVKNLIIGLGYTAVTTSDSGIGIAGTYFAGKKPASLNKDYVDPEGKPASILLGSINDNRMVQRSMALALINALNYHQALTFPESKGNYFLLNKLGVKKGEKVAMVGMFRPMVNMIKENGIDLEVLDTTLDVGKQEHFYDKLKHWADVLILSATSILNNTTEDILNHTHKKIKTIMLGPSTPMVKAAFEHLPVHILAGSIPIEKEKVLKAVCHGTGTPIIKKFCRKSYVSLI